MFKLERISENWYMLDDEKHSYSIKRIGGVFEVCNKNTWQIDFYGKDLDSCIAWLKEVINE